MRSIFYFIIGFVGLSLISGCSVPKYTVTNADCQPSNMGSIVKDGANAFAYNWYYSPFFSPLSNQQPVISTTSEITSATTGQYLVNTLLNINQTINGSQVQLVTSSQRYDVMHKVEFLNTNSFAYNTSGDLVASTNYLATVKKPIQQGDFVFFDFELQSKNSTSWITIDFNDNPTSINNGSLFPSLMIQSSGISGIIYKKVGNGFTPHSFSLNSNNGSPNIAKIRIQKQFNVSNSQDEVLVYVNGSYLLTLELINFSTPKYFKIRGFSNGALIKKIHTSSPCFVPSALVPSFLSLHKQYDGNTYIAGNDLKIKYDEKYDSDNLNYKIFDWKRNVVISNINGGGQILIAPISTHGYGIKYHTIPITTANLINDATYFIEIKNTKGEVYKAKFMYKAPSNNGTNSQ